MAAFSIGNMEDSLYTAAARGMIEKFKGIGLASLETPNRNNVLHVNLATKGCIKFTEHVLNECPSLLLQVNAQGRTPLHIAARHGHSDIVKFLIRFRAKRADQGDLEQAEATVDAVRRMLRMTDLKSDTALHIAARYGHVGVVQELLEFEDPDYSYSVNENQETPVYIAAERGERELLSKILDKFQSTSHVGPQGRTALHAAAMRDNTADLGLTRTILMKIKGSVTRETDENGHTPLHYAAHLGHSRVVEELLKCDEFAAYIADKKSQMTPILMAARQGHFHTVRMILSFCPGCCEIVDKRGWNILHFMGIRGNPRDCFNKVIYGLVQDMFDAKDESGITPEQVYLACCSKPSYFNTNQRRQEKERIMELLEDILNEEVAEKAVNPYSAIHSTEYIEKRTKEMEKVKESHLVVATLIATVTFAAAMTVPGGYKSEKGADQGTPFLLHDAAFIAFVISDALAFFFSMFAIVLHFRTFAGGENVVNDTWAAAAWIVCALWALMIAFYTGFFAVLRPSLGLAIVSLCLGLIFHFGREIHMPLPQIYLFRAT